MPYFANKEITVELTNRCSSKCIICPREKLTWPLADMPFDLCKKIVDDAIANGIKLFDTCGFGDPFLYPQLFDCFEYIKKVKPNMKIFVSSTCANMHPNMHKNVLKYIDILKLSVFGTTKEVYTKVHGSRKFQKATNNIHQLLELKKKMKTDKPHIISLFTITEFNQHQIQEWIDWWQPKVDEVYVWEPHNWVLGRHYRNINGKPQRSCGRPLFGPLNVAVNGLVFVCCFDFNKQMIVGDLKSQTIDEIMQGEVLQKIQEKHRNNDFKGLICQYCDQTVHDESVLVYASDSSRHVGMSNSSKFSYADKMPI